MGKKIDFLLGIPKSIIFNLKYLGLKNGLKMPIFVSKNVKISNLKGNIKINSPIKPGMIKLGFGNVGIFDKKYEKSIWEVTGEICFDGRCNLGHGFRIVVFENGKLMFGDNFVLTANSSIITSKKISFGSNCLMSWKCQVMDTDFHSIYENGIKKEKKAEINIGNNVWICSNVNILKGTNIGNNSVIGAGSVVNGKFFEENILISGMPARKVRDGVKWDIN